MRRLGGSRDIPFDVRIVAAVNEKPQKLIREGRLREDLYYRLGVIRLTLPPCGSGWPAAPPPCWPPCGRSWTISPSCGSSSAGPSVDEPPSPSGRRLHPGGYHPEVDRLRDIMANGKGLVAPSRPGRRRRPASRA